MNRFILIFIFLNLLIFPQKQLTQEDLKNKDLQELYLMRNEIYARYGRPFKTHELHKYFISKKWYRVDTTFTESRLNDIERKNAELIRKMELELMKENYIKKDNKDMINFRNIINRWQFGEFSKDEIKMLSENGFIVYPSDYEQFFFIYDDNAYKGIASFITTDVILQLYHIFFDFTLRNVERDKLFPLLKKLTEEMILVTKNLYKNTKNERIKKAALLNLAYFSVPYYFLTGDKNFIEPYVKDIVLKEIERCESHSGRFISSIFNHIFDYAQFIPRGHYTREEVLKRFFLAMMWYGTNSFNTEDEIQLIQSLIITKQLYEGRMIDIWKKIYEITEFFSGSSDDLSPFDYMVIIERMWNKIPDYNSFSDDKILKKIKEDIKISSRKRKIITFMEGEPSGPVFRFMGQRYIPDSEILQRLSKWPERPFPKGLDVMAVLGSDVAKDILMNEYKEQERWNEYPYKLDTLINEFKKIKEDEWRKNLYYNWLYCLKSLIKLSNEFRYPFFMNNDAWKLKSLNTSLASWTELRHDVVLYGKQSVAECGDGEEWIPEPPKGYVEPNVEFYKRLKELIVSTKEGLSKRELLTKRIREKFDRFYELVSFLEDVSVKELNKIPLTKEEFQKIFDMGGTLEYLTTTVITDDEGIYNWHEIQSDADKRIPLIVDVHTSLDEVLQEAVGNVFEIYVVVEIDGYLKLARGGVFSYYEFTHPASDRLTDENWQNMIDEGKTPKLPHWTNRFISSKKPHRLFEPRYIEME